MKVIIFGGARDGEMFEAPDGALSYKFASVEVPVRNSSMPVSPFGPVVTYVSWNIKKRKAYWTRKDYLVLVEPRLEKWMMESFGPKDEWDEE